MGIDFGEFPIILQYNKMDLPNASSVEDMEEYLNPAGRPYFAASAIKGEGVLVALTAVVKNILHNLKQDQNGDFEGFHEDGEPVVHEKEDTISIRVADPTSAPALPSIPAMDILRPIDEPETKLPAAMPEEEDEPLEAELQQEEEELHTGMPEESHGELHGMPVMTMDGSRIPTAEGEQEGAFPLFEMPGDEQSGGNLDDSFEEFLANVKSPMIPDEEYGQDVLEEVSASEDFGNTDFHVAELLKKDVEDASRFKESFMGDTEGPAASSPEARREFIAAQELQEELPSPAALKLAPEPAPEPAPHEGGPKSRQAFFIPVRITTTSGIKEVNLRVNVEMGLLGDGVEQITNIEALQPVSRIPISPRSTTEAVLLPPATEKPRQSQTPLPKPSQKDKKSSVFQRFLGIK
jgi:hypothetical protein